MRNSRYEFILETLAMQGPETTGAIKFLNDLMQDVEIMYRHASKVRAHKSTYNLNTQVSKEQQIDEAAQLQRDIRALDRVSLDLHEWYDRRRRE